MQTVSEAQPDKYTAAISQALQARAPGKNRTGWYLEISDQTGLTDKSIAQWTYGNYPPDAPSYWKLVDCFGVSFHDDVTRAMTSWRVVENDKALFQLIEDLRSDLDAMRSRFPEGNVTPIRVEGRGK